MEINLFQSPNPSDFVPFRVFFHCSSFRHPPLFISVHFPTALSPRNHTPSPNLIVSVSGKKGLAIRTPSQANALRLSALFSILNIFRLDLIKFALLLQVEHSYSSGCRSSDSVSV